MEFIKISGMGILIGVMVFICAFLVGSFIEVSFDISRWKEDTRLTVGVISGIFMGISFLVSFAVSAHDK